MTERMIQDKPLEVGSDIVAFCMDIHNFLRLRVPRKYSGHEG